jgi:diguanylate cyclase (GGDEF)-like protein
MHNTIRSTPDLIAAAWDALLEQTAEALLLIDDSGQIIAVSTAATQLLGHRREGLIGEDVRVCLGLDPATALADQTALPGWPWLMLRHTRLAPAGALLTLLSLPAPPDEAAAALRREQQLREVLMTIGSALDIDQILDNVVRLSIELSGADAGSLPLYDQENDQVMIAHLANLEDSPRPGLSQRRGEGLIWQVIDSRQPALFNDYPGEPGAIPLLIQLGVRAAAAVPVLAGADILGVLILYHRRPGVHFSPRDIELLQAISRQTGVALQNARLYQAALVEADRRHALYNASVEIGAALDSEQLYAVIHHSASRLMRCDTIVIGLADEERGEIEYVYLWDEQGSWPSHRAPITRGLIGYVVRHAVSLRIDNSDAQTEALFAAEPFGPGERQSRAILATVLSVGELVIGGISVQSSAPDAYSPGDLSALEMLAATAAIAIQNAQLFTQMQQLAALDPLTAIPNRRHFYELAVREVERSARYGHTLSAIMLDADHFKTINDTYGHIAGDQVLQTIAARCRGDLREVDMLARFGGEEFAVLLPETDRDQALQVARRLAACIADSPVVTDAGSLAVTISLGVASAPPGTLTTIEALLNAADQALYRAKRAGRNQVSG